MTMSDNKDKDVAAEQATENTKAAEGAGKPPESPGKERKKRAKGPFKHDAQRKASVEAAVLAASRLRQGVAPTREQLAIADPDTLLAELRSGKAMAELPAPYSGVPVSAEGMSNPGTWTTYTEEEGKRLCEWIQSGKSLQRYLLATGLRSSTVYGWLTRHEQFRAAYEAAQRDRADTLVDEMLEIADEAQKYRGDPAAVYAARLRVDTRKWIACRLRPTKWGDAPAVAGGNGVTIQIGIPRRTEQAVKDIDTDGNVIDAGENVIDAGGNAIDADGDTVQSDS